MSFTDEERAELIAALSRTAEMVGLLLDVLLVSRLSEEHGGDADRDERHTEHHEPFEHDVANRRKRHGMAALTMLDHRPSPTICLLFSHAVRPPAFVQEAT